MIEDTSRETAAAFMKMNEYVDVLIPRGGAGLIKAVVNQATIPVIETGTGNCHIFVDETADFDMAMDIILNAKTQRIGVCNACESLVIHEKIADTFLPELDQRYKDQASAIVGDSMVRQIRKHRAVWYPGAEEMLTALKNRGYHLVILSNCKVAYRKAHWEEFRMERWFEQFYDCESYGFCPKTEIVQEVIRDYPGPYLVIGDRRQDLECARSCKSPFIGCLYGYGEKGELDGADYFVKSVEEITGII